MLQQETTATYAGGGYGVTLSPPSGNWGVGQALVDENGGSIVPIEFINRPGNGGGPGIE